MSIITNARENQTVDIVLVYGKEPESNKSILRNIEYCKKNNLTYAILGDGFSPIKLSDIQKLPKARHVAICGHGEIKQNNDVNRHYIFLENKVSDTLEMIKEVQNQTQSKNIVLGSCYGGKVVDELRDSPNRELFQGTSLFVSSSNDEPTFIGDSLNIVENYVKKIKLNKILPMVELVKESITTSPLTMEYAHQPEDILGNSQPIKTHTIRRRDRILYHDTRKFCEYQHNLFNIFINEIVLDEKANLFINELKDFYHHFEKYKTKLDKQEQACLLSFNMSSKAVETYQNKAFVHHAFFNDAEVLDFLLKNNVKAPSLLLYTTILFKNDNDSADAIEVLLKHSGTILVDHNVNSFETSFYTTKILETPLTLALEKGKINIVKALIKAGADIYMSDAFYNTPSKMIKDNESFHKIFPELIQEAEAQFNKIISSHDETATYLSRARDKFETICNKNLDMDFFHGKTFLPKDDKVFDAFQNYLIIMNDRNIRKDVDVLNSMLSTPSVAKLGFYGQNYHDQNQPKRTRPHRLSC